MEPVQPAPVEIIEETLGTTEPIEEEVVSVAEPEEPTRELTDQASDLDDAVDSEPELLPDDDEPAELSKEEDIPDVVQVISESEHMSITLSDKGVVTLRASVSSRKKMKKLRTKLSCAVPEGLLWETSMETMGDHSYTLTGSLKRKAKRDLIAKQLKEFANGFQSP